MRNSFIAAWVQGEEDTRLDLNGKSSSDHHVVRLVTYKMQTTNVLNDEAS